MGLHKAVASRDAGVYAGAITVIHQRGRGEVRNEDSAGAGGGGSVQRLQPTTAGGGSGGSQQQDVESGYSI